jgi:CRISPR-associated protein Cas1
MTTTTTVIGPPMGAEEVAERLDALEQTYTMPGRGPVAVCDGFAVRVVVERGALEVHDGVGPHRRTRRFDKATHQLARLIVIGDGMVSTAALRWCKAAGVDLVVYDQASETLLTSGRVDNDDARLRRAQALALYSPAGLAIARYLIAGKITGQAQVAATLLASPGTDETLAKLLEDLERCESLEEVQHIEAVAAAVYFAAWDGLEVTFTGRDAAKVPEHWRRFSGRRSAINPGTARSATDPVNAALNYAYRLLEAEARLACLRVGLDPGLGIMHADVKGRDSLALDVLEVARPLVDRAVLELVRDRRLRRRDFTEDGRGVVRLCAPLTHELASLMASWGVLLAPTVEHVAELLARSSAYDVVVPAVLTRSKHKAAARRRSDGARPLAPVPGPNPGGIAPRRAPRQKPRIDPQARLLPLCVTCGAILPRPIDRTVPVRAYCDDCLPERRAEVVPTMRAASEARAREVEAATGTRPSHTPEARARRREANRLQRLDQLARGVPAGREGLAWWHETALPALATVSLPAIAKATGVSTSAASKWRRGILVPSPMHWGVLAELAGVEVPPKETQRRSTIVRTQQGVTT